LWLGVWKKGTKTKAKRGGILCNKRIEMGTNISRRVTWKWKIRRGKRGKEKFDVGIE
jgi:hypothetical protein